MCVNVLLADDTEVVRRAICNLLSEREDIKVVGEVATFSEVIQKAAELKPDVIVFDLHMAGNNFSTPFLSCYKLLAISFANDDEAQELADSIGAVKLLDKAELANELIPRFWNWHQRAYRVSDHNFSANVTSQPSNLSDRKSIVSARANGIRKSLQQCLPYSL